VHLIGHFNHERCFSNLASIMEMVRLYGRVISRLSNSPSVPSGQEHEGGKHLLSAGLLSFRLACALAGGKDRTRRRLPCGCGMGLSYLMRHEVLSVGQCACRMESHLSPERDALIQPHWVRRTSGAASSNELSRPENKFTTGSARGFAARWGHELVVEIAHSEPKYPIITSRG
jgi:hypothetical protein